MEGEQRPLSAVLKQMSHRRCYLVAVENASARPYSDSSLMQEGREAAGKEKVEMGKEGRSPPCLLATTFSYW